MVRDAKSPPRWLKSFLALLLTVILLMALFPYLSRALSPEAVVDQGNRSLLVLHIDGATNAPSLAFQISSQVGGEMDAIFSISQPGITYGEKGNTKELSVKILMIARESHNQEISCTSPGYDVHDVAFVDLPDSVQRAILLDAGSGAASAVNYENENRQPSSPESVSEYFKTQRFDVWEGKTWLVSDKSGSPYLGDADTFNIRCGLSASAAWRASGEPWPQSDTTTLLPPQVNFVSDQSGTAAVAGVEGRLDVARRSGSVLRESYPPMSVGTTDWNYRLSGIKYSGGGLYYTDQPTFIFSRRSAADEKAIVLMLAGAGLGAVAGLVIGLLGALFDAAWERMASRRNVRAPEGWRYPSGS